MIEWRLFPFSFMHIIKGLPMERVQGKREVGSGSVECTGHSVPDSSIIFLMLGCFYIFHSYSHLWIQSVPIIFDPFQYNL